MNIDCLLKCFCQARKTQTFFLKNLETEQLNTDEKKLLSEIVMDAQNISNKIQDFCKLYD